MARYHEISSLFTKNPTSSYVVSNVYYKVNRYYPDLYDNYKKHLRYLVSEPPTHPLAKRFDKLIKYVAKLTNNPNPKKIKRDVIKIMREQHLPPEYLHDLFHIILGQSLEIFLNKKSYTIEEYIYETIALIMEEGMTMGSQTVAVMYNRAMPEFINNKTVSLKKIYHKELKIVKYYLKKHNLLSKENYLLFKKELLKSKWFTKFHFFIFLNLYDINPNYPLAINFKNEVLREFPNVIPPEEYKNYYERFYSFVDYIYKNLNLYKSAEITDYFMERLEKISEFKFDKNFIRELFTRIEIFPSETKEIIKKFITYMYAVLDRYFDKKITT